MFNTVTQLCRNENHYRLQVENDDASNRGNAGLWYIYPYSFKCWWTVSELTGFFDILDMLEELFKWNSHEQCEKGKTVTKIQVSTMIEMYRTLNINQERFILILQGQNMLHRIYHTFYDNRKAQNCQN